VKQAQDIKFVPNIAKRGAAVLTLADNMRAFLAKLGYSLAAPRASEQ